MQKITFTRKLIAWCWLQVFIVAGGIGSSRLSSKEMLIGQDAKEWTMGPQLPSARGGARGVTIGNRFLLTGIK